VQQTSIAVQLAELKELLGPPPVLSTESTEAFYRIMEEFLECFQPGDFMERALVKDLTCHTWDIVRLNRHKTLVMERKYRQRLKYQAQRTRIMAQRKEAIAGNLGAGAVKPANELERVLDLEDLVEGSVENIDQILNRPAEELDHAHALERAIEYFERLDKLLNAAIARRNDVLDQLERYRDGLGQHLRRVSDQIIDGECKPAEVEPECVPPVAPAGDQDDR
jgi:hypothetical protein